MASLSVMTPSGSIKTVELDGLNNYTPEKGEVIMFDGRVEDYSFEIAGSDIILTLPNGAELVLTNMADLLAEQDEENPTKVTIASGDEGDVLVLDNFGTLTEIMEAAAAGNEPPEPQTPNTFFQGDLFGNEPQGEEPVVEETQDDNTRRGFDGQDNSNNSNNSNNNSGNNGGGSSNNTILDETTTSSIGNTGDNPADTDTNEALTLTVTPVTAEFEEGNTSAGATVATSSATDPDGGDITYSLNDDSGFYTIDASTGTVTLTTAGAAEVNAGNDLPNFTVSASSTTGQTSSDTATVNPADTDDTSADIDNNFTITVVTSDEVTNSSESKDVTTTLSGVDSDAVSVEVTFSDGTNTVKVDATKDSDGNWIVADTDISSLNDGNVTVSAKVTDDAGNTKTVEDSLDLDTTATITVDTELVGGTEVVANTGVSNLNNPGDTATFSVDEPVDSLTVNIKSYKTGHDDADVVITYSDGTTGSFALDDFISGDINNKSTNVTFSVDGKEISSVAISHASDNSNEFKVNNAISTSEEVLEINGTTTDVEKDQVVTITIKDTDGNTLATTTAVVGEDGTYSASVDATSFADKEIVTSVSVTDIAGNPATSSTDDNLDTSITVTSDLDASSDTGSSDSDNITNDTTPTINGTTQAGALVVITVAGVEVGSAIADSDGNYSITTDELTEGTKDLTITATDVKGNTDSTTETITIDTTASDTDALAITDIVDNTGDYSSVTMHGTGAEVGDKITIYDEDGNDVATTYVDDNGNWEVRIDSLTNTGVNDNEFFSVSETDTAGNETAQTDTTHYWHGDWENAITEDSDDYVMAGDGDDTITHDTASDNYSTVSGDDSNNFTVLDGGAGDDTVNLGKAMGDYTISVDSTTGYITITETTGDVTELRNVETINFTDGTYDTGSGTFTSNDLVPTSEDETVTLDLDSQVTETSTVTNSLTTNLVITLDLSGSMTNSSGTIILDDNTATTRLQLAIDSLENLISEYEDAGSVNVNLTTFSSSSSSSGWMDASTALNTLQTLQAGGMTNYESAVSTTVSNYTNVPDADNTVALFISDGAPTMENYDYLYDGWDGNKLDDSYVNQWSNFIENNVDKLIVVGMGTGITNTSYLETLAVEVGQVQTEMLLIENDVELNETLIETMINSENTVVGNLLDNVSGGDGDISIDTVTIGNTTYTSSDFASGASVTTPEGAILKIDFATGKYLYTASTANFDSDVTETFSVTASDEDGDPTTFNVNVNVNVDDTASAPTLTMDITELSPTTADGSTAPTYEQTSVDMSGNATKYYHDHTNDDYDGTSGDDYVKYNRHQEDYADLNTGSGDDKVYFNEHAEGDTTTGSGDDQVYARQQLQGTLDLGSDDDTFYGEEHVTGTINAGSGDDNIYTRQQFQGTVNAGSGDDVLESGEHLSGTIDMGSGNDYVKTGQSITGTVDGGDGYDTIYIGDQNAKNNWDSIKGNLSNFEHVVFADGTQYDLDENQNLVASGTNDSMLSGSTIYAYSIDLHAALTDTDSESLSDITLENIPSGATLSVGGTQLTATDGTYTISSDLLDDNGDVTVTLTSPTEVEQDDLNDIVSTVTSTEDNGGDTATSFATESYDSLFIEDDMTFDFDSLSEARVETLDTIDMSGGSEGSTLQGLSVDDFMTSDTDSTDTEIMKIIGDSEDEVKLNTEGNDAEWTKSNETFTDESGNEFDVYQGGDDATVKLFIDTDVVVTDI